MSELNLKVASFALVVIEFRKKFFESLESRSNNSAKAKQSTKAPVANQRFLKVSGGDQVALWLNGLPAMAPLFRAPIHCLDEERTGSPLKKKRKRTHVLDEEDDEDLDEYDVDLYNVNATREAFESIVDSLSSILADDRDYYEAGQFRRNSRISLRQTSKTGARTLFITASPCTDNRYFALFEKNGRKHYKMERELTLEMFQSVGVDETTLDYRPNFAFTSKWRKGSVLKAVKGCITAAKGKLLGAAASTLARAAAYFSPSGSNVQEEEDHTINYEEEEEEESIINYQSSKGYSEWPNGEFVEVDNDVSFDSTSSEESD